MKRYFVSISFLLIAGLFLYGCTIQVATQEETQIIKCSNLLFDCSYNDCHDQCASSISAAGHEYISSKPVNDGKGCECKYRIK